VFLLVRDAEQALDLVDEAARKFLDRVVRTNAVTFSDDMRTRAWSSVYYVENAVQRIKNLTDQSRWSRCRRA
jgi:Mg2+/Co2+ transporter CorC